MSIILSDQKQTSRKRTKDGHDSGVCSAALTVVPSAADPIGSRTGGESQLSTVLIAGATSKENGHMCLGISAPKETV